MGNLPLDPLGLTDGRGKLEANTSLEHQSESF
jgi:hypothetical protein